MSNLDNRLNSLSPEKRALLMLRLKEKQKGAAGAALIQPRQDQTILPLSFAQQQLWLIDQMEPESPLYNIPAALRLSGSLSLPALEKSLNLIVQRHSVLRSKYPAQQGHPLQIIDAHNGTPIEVSDLSTMPTLEQDTQVRLIAADEAAHPFDLANGPLIRCRMLKISERDHVILLTMHHIISDGWSIGVLVNEWAAAYNALLQGLDPDLPELPIQYVDFAAWQRESLRGETLENLLQYWKKKLADVPPLIELPLDHARPALQSHQGAHYRFHIETGVYEQVKALCQRENTTLFTVLLAGFNVLLYRYSHQNDFCVGTPSANRAQMCLENLIGYFVNTLVLRSEINDQLSFLAYLRRVQNTVLEAYAHQDIPFEMLVEALQPERDLSRSPLIQVMFDLERTRLESIQFNGLTPTLIEVESGTSKFDLSLIMDETSRGLEGQFEFATDLFDERTIQRMAGHYQTLLAAIAAQPDRAIEKLPILTTAERQKILSTWNQTAAPPPPDSCLHTLFEDWADRQPSATALVVKDASLTYAELDQRANQLAHHLLSLGVTPDAPVALCFERSVEMITAILAVLKVGSAYVPLDPSFPDERLSFMLDDCAAAILLTSADLLPRFPAFSGQALAIDHLTSTLDALPASRPDVKVSPHDLAYIIYTSGSTGKPKGVMLEHRSALAMLSGFEFLAPAGDALCGVSLCPYGFDVSVWEFFSNLSYGGALHLLTSDVFADPAAFASYIVSRHITSAYIPPALLNPLADELEALADQFSIPLTRLLVGVEPIQQRTLQRFLCLEPSMHIVNGYGPTETAICATFHAFSGETDPERRVPIGKAVPHYDVYLVDTAMQPVPVGVTGEVIIGGPGVARGYLNRPELTDEKFVPHPFDTASGRRVYRTGDLARYLEDGDIEFIGRVDHQVKIRGFRVELGEIETLLGNHPAIHQALVIDFADPAGQKRLAVYLVVKPSAAQPSISDLVRFLKDALPEYMIPAAFVFLDAIPLTPNGKTDRKRLPAPDGLRPDLEAAYTAPRSPTEDLLAGMWSEILGVSRVGVHDNFFDLGGHSLLATQLAARIRSAFEIEMPVRTVFETPTIATLAEWVECTHLNMQSSQPLSPILPVLRDETPLPLSFSQQRLWFLDQLEPGSPFYNIFSSFDITGDLNIPALKNSLNEIIQRHEILRTCFRASPDGQARQEILPVLTLSLPVVDLQDVPPALQQSEVQRLTLHEARQPFDLASVPLLRAKLLRLSPERHILLFNMHHIISDGWSTSILMREVSILYQIFLQQQPSTLPELPIQYADFAAWQRAWLTGEVMNQQLDYWKKQLQGLPPLLELPTDHPRPEMQTSRGKQTFFHISPSLSTHLKSLSKHEDATLFMTLLAAFQILLYRYSGQEDIAVGTPIANRQRAEIEDLIGVFINTLVIRTRLDGAPTFREILQRVRTAALDAYAHQDVPFETLVDALQPERDLSRSPLFQVMFVFQNLPAQKIDLSGLSIEPMPVDLGTSNFDLTLSMAEEGDRLTGTLEYNSDLFNASSIRRMCEQFIRLLENIVLEPDCPIAQIKILSALEKRKILSQWNETNTVFPLINSLHGLFEAQVVRTPASPALVMPARGGLARETLNYTELNNRANQLAHYLLQCGLQPGQRVGICLSRSMDMAAALLAILKAGGAYVPLDPVYPRERLAFMIQDANLPYILTEKRLSARLPMEPARHIILDHLGEILKTQPNTNPDLAFSSDQLAYVIYTSGSTGQPKGVMVSHRSVVNHNLAAIQLFDLTPIDRTLQFATINFDAAVEEIFPTWFSGACLVLRPSEDLLSGEELRQLIVQEQITILDLPTAYWQEWVTALTLSGVALPPSLRLVIVGGEKAHTDYLITWQRLPGSDRVRWLNTYGPTEGTVIASVYENKEKAEAIDPRTDIPIGRPIANARLYILDALGNPVPMGTGGELMIGGEGVAQGYLNRPELTAERFIPDPFSPTPGARMYRTGDLARFRPDGNIEFAGRIDHQIKIRGFRIELDEIESLLRQHPSVQDAAVTVHEDAAGHKRLCAYFVGEAEPAAALETFLKSSLPAYMIPSTFTRLAALPLTPSGKLDRRALPVSEQGENAAPSDQLSAPRNADEAALIEIWKTVLSIAQVGIHDNFFELGGDSILSIQVIARARQAGLHLSPRLLFEHPTVAGLAAAALHTAPLQTEQGTVTGSVPLTPIQAWFFDQDLPKPAHWNQSILLSVRPSLHPDSFQQALTFLLAHHDALRLTFSPTDQGWQQVNAGLPETLPFSYFNLRGLSAQEQLYQLSLQSNRIQGTLDLQSGVLIHLAYFDFGPQRPGRLLLAAHHLVVDGVSWRVLLEDFATLYQQAESGLPLTLPPKSSSYQAWAQHLDQFARSEALLAELPFWRGQFTTTPPPIPIDFQLGPNSEASAAALSVSLSRDETSTLLESLPEIFGTRINDALLAALALALSDWSDTRTAAFDLETHGREDLFDDLDLSRTVGWFTAVYPLVVKLPSRDPALALKHIKEQLRAVPNNGIGFGLLRYLSGDASLAALPQPQVSFNYLGQSDQALQGSGPFIAPAPEEPGLMRDLRGVRAYLIDINAIILDNCLRVEWSFSRNFHTTATIQRLADRYIQSLRDVIALSQSTSAPQYTPSDFSDAELNELEIEKLLDEIGDDF